MKGDLYDFFDCYHLSQHFAPSATLRLAAYVIALATAQKKSAMSALRSLRKALRTLRLKSVASVPQLPRKI